MNRNALPGQQLPYFLESGEGQRYRLGRFLATIIGRRLDTGSLMEGVVLTGAKDSAMPSHRHHQSHEAIYVIEGSARLRLEHRGFVLEAGDFASVPPGTVHGFTFTSHRTRLLTWTFGGDVAGMYSGLGQPSEAVTYLSQSEPPNWKKTLPGIDLEFVRRVLRNHAR